MSTLFWEETEPFSFRFSTRFVWNVAIRKSLLQQMDSEIPPMGELNDPAVLGFLI